MVSVKASGEALVRRGTVCSEKRGWFLWEINLTGVYFALLGVDNDLFAHGYKKSLGRQIGSV